MRPQRLAEAWNLKRHAEAARRALQAELALKDTFLEVLEVRQLPRHATRAYTATYDWHLTEALPLQCGIICLECSSAPRPVHKPCVCVCPVCAAPLG